MFGHRNLITRRTPCPRVLIFPQETQLQRRIAARLSAMGFAVMRFDFNGLGQSEGRFPQTDFTSNVNNLIAASAYLTKRDLTPSLLIGHSLGGAAVLKAAVQNLNAALLVVHSPVDETVGIENASQILDAARHPKSFVTLEKADHLLHSTDDADYAAGVIAA